MPNTSELSIYKRFLHNIWLKEVRWYITSTSHFSPPILILTSSIFPQQPIPNFNLHGIFYKPLRNMCDMPRRIDSVVLCKRVIEFTSQLRETKITLSSHLCFFNRIVWDSPIRWLRRFPYQSIIHCIRYTKKSLCRDLFFKIWVMSSGSHQ